MTSEFQPTEFAFGDRAGQGRWEVGHWRQHIRYTQTLAAMMPAVIIDDHPLATIGTTDLERKVWLNDHYIVHQQLRTYANITGVDLSAVDLNNEQQFFEWLDDHATEHQQLDQFFGVG